MIYFEKHILRLLKVKNGTLKVKYETLVRGLLGCRLKASRLRHGKTQQDLSLINKNKFDTKVHSGTIRLPTASIFIYSNLSILWHVEK